MPGGLEVRLDGEFFFFCLSLERGDGFVVDADYGLDLPIMVAKPQAQYCVSMVPASLDDVTAARLALMPMKV